MEEMKELSSSKVSEKKNNANVAIWQQECVHSVLLCK